MIGLPVPKWGSSLVDACHRVLLERDREAQDDAGAGVDLDELDASLDLLREGLHQGKAKTFFWRNGHSFSVVFDRNARLAGIADRREIYPDASPVVAERIFDGIGDELVDHQ